MGKGGRESKERSSRTILEENGEEKWSVNGAPGETYARARVCVRRVSVWFCRGSGEREWGESARGR